MFLPSIPIRLQCLKVLTFLLTIIIFPICFADVPAPTKVVGIFKNEKRDPTIAASLAVSLFNSNKKRNLNFTYESIQIQRDSIASEPMEPELKAKLHHTIIVTGEPFLCERIAKILPEMGSYLVCYGEPTIKTYELIEVRPTLYLSRPNPEALIHCLFKLIKLIIGDQQNTLISSLIFDSGHSNLQVLKNLLLVHLQNEYGEFNDTFKVKYLLEESEQDLLSHKSQTYLNLSFINAIIPESKSKDVLCHFYHNIYSEENRTLILLGPSTQKWLNSGDDAKGSCDSYHEMRKHKRVSCTMQELRNAAEGHLFLEYPFPPWSTSYNESRDVSIIKIKTDLWGRLQTNDTLTDYNEAPLAFDSVWAVLIAVNSAAKRNRPVSESMVGEALERKSFAGITGEKFSFIKYKNGSGGYVRNTGDAIITVYRFENGKYVPLARYFNANNRFQWLPDHLFSGGTHTWKPIRPECPNLSNLSQSRSSGWILLMLMLVLVLLLLLMFLAFYSLK